MLFPRFSTRRLLLFIAVAALVSLILAQAVRGQSWAVAISIAGGLYLVTHLIHAALFFVAWLVSLAGRERRRAVGSPFAAHATPTLNKGPAGRTSEVPAGLPITLAAMASAEPPLVDEAEVPDS